MFDISPTEWTAILLSLRVAIIATLVATPFGIALATQWSEAATKAVPRPVKCSTTHQFVDHAARILCTADMNINLIGTVISPLSR